MEISKALDADGRLRRREDLAKFYVNRAVTLDAQDCYKEALPDYNLAVDIIVSLDEVGILPDRNLLAGTLMKRALTYEELEQYEEALND